MSCTNISVPVSDLEQILNSLKSDLLDFFSGKIRTLDQAERTLLTVLSNSLTDILKVYLQNLDQSLLLDKSKRKALGLTVERKHCRRSVLTSVGALDFERTYYKKKDGSYVFALDELVGLEKYQRISDSVENKIVSAARSMSYSRSCDVIANGMVSSRTVCSKIRQCVPSFPIVERRSVPVIHVDADEDHVKLQNGRGAMVYLASVYEGLDHNGSRGICRNCWHKAEFRKSADDFWEELITEIERRYDLRYTKIYLHGDGAAWIKKGLEWLPNSTYVLDRFHVTQAVARIVSGIDDWQVKKSYQRVLHMALREDNKELLIQAVDSLVDQYPGRSEVAYKNLHYLLDNYPAIQIWRVDAEARNGGASEPHVSHVLSARLSSRPMAWSERTLKSFAPILAADDFRIIKAS